MTTHQRSSGAVVSMRALSITQPWASLIMIGAKRFETRSWGTSYRGPLAIHAAKTFPGWARDLCLTSPFFEALTEGRGEAFGYVLGAVVAIAELVDVGRITMPEALGYVLGANEVAFGDWTPGRYAWLLADVRPLAERLADTPTPAGPTPNELGVEPAFISLTALRDTLPKAGGAP